MMLARSFLSADELRISEPERVAMIQVLGLMERGELPPEKFNMEQSTFSCGTPSCIGGYIASFMGYRTQRELIDYVSSAEEEGSPLFNLYWSATSPNITPDQAACALRSFLSTGNPNWDEALS